MHWTSHLRAVHFLFSLKFLVYLLAMLALTINVGILENNKVQLIIQTKSQVKGPDTLHSLVLGTNLSLSISLAFLSIPGVRA